MKDNLMIFIIGLLVGAIIATGAFFVYSKADNNNCSDKETMEMHGNPPSMPNGENNQGERPERPDANNNQTQNNNTVEDNK